MGQPKPLFHLFSIFSSIQYNFYSKSMWKNVMSIHYTVPGFEPTTSKTWVVSHNKLDQGSRPVLLVCCQRPKDPRNYLSFFILYSHTLAVLNAFTNACGSSNQSTKCRSPFRGKILRNLLLDFCYLSLFRNFHNIFWFFLKDTW